MIASKLKNYLWELVVLLIGSFFGYILMFGTFSKRDGELLIATKAWSDFASHIPLIRSFSFGSNFPPQYPLFPGEPIKYHFVFYSVVGFLEKLGVPIDIALNSLSFLGFVFLIFMIYFFAKELFKSKAIGIISVIFFLFNSSLSFVYFFQKFPINRNSINQIISNHDFMSFAPYGQGLISAFWSLNIFTNQRHLALSIGLSLLLIYLVIKPLIGKSQLQPKYYVLLGILLGLSYFLNTAILLSTVLILFCLAIAFSKIRKETILLLLFAGIIILPQYLYAQGGSGFPTKLLFGYLVSSPTPIKLAAFWFYNLGLGLFLIPLGFIFSNKVQRKIFISFAFLFIVGISVQFSPEIAANHKFFNYFIIIGNMFSAYVLYLLWKKKQIFKPLVGILAFLMVMGGLIDIFPIINDGKVTIPDYEKNHAATWIKNNTPRSSIFLNTTYLYDPASLAGRKIYLGWPYFAWSQGYDTNGRSKSMTEMLESDNKHSACKLLKKNGITYIEIKTQNPPDPDVPAISGIYNKEFSTVYSDAISNYLIYSVKDSCD